MLRGERLRGTQLSFADHAFVTVLNVLYSILEIAAFIRQRALNCVCSTRHMALEPVGHQVHGLTDLESMTRHNETLPAVSRRTEPS